MTFLAAAELRFGAAVGFYGGGIVNAYSADSKLPSLLPHAKDLRTPWLGLFGDVDRGIPVADVESLRTALSTYSSVQFDVVRYPNAQHGFHCDAREEYDAAAAEDAWARTLDWFDRQLATRTS
jgi:carboxymethylenebutenolidase